MWPLLLKDGLSLPYTSCMLLFYAVAYHVFDLGRTKPLKQALVIMAYCCSPELRTEFTSTLLKPSKGNKLEKKNITMNLLRTILNTQFKKTKLTSKSKEKHRLFPICFPSLQYLELI